MDKAERGAKQTIARLKHYNIEGEVIMDIGANIGHVSRFLLDGGVKRVVSYEPHPLAFKELAKRCNDGELINAGLLTKKGSIAIHTSKSDAVAGYFCNASMASGAAGVSTEVDVLSFPAELKRVKPTAIKMDVEGSEYDMLLNTDLPKSVKWLSMEVHKLNVTVGLYLFAALARRMFAQGFGMATLQPSVRPAAGVCKSFWGFMQVDFMRGVASNKDDIKWIASMCMHAEHNSDNIKTRIQPLQELFDKEFSK
jgi:FkbM family methyltransferase